jgi:hypothetical protein
VKTIAIGGLRSGRFDFRRKKDKMILCCAAKNRLLEEVLAGSIALRDEV